MDLFTYALSKNNTGGGSNIDLSNYATTSYVSAKINDKQDKVQLGTITLSTSWSGNGPYSQVVTVSGATITENSKIDLQLTPEQIISLNADGITNLIIENNNGTLIIHAIGGINSDVLIIQCSIMEVEV